MNKMIGIMISIIVVALAIITGIVIFNPKQEENFEMELSKVAEKEILDECTDEYEQINSNETVETDSNQEKISPNCALILKSYYKDCKHTTNKYSNIPDDLINQSKEKVQEMYADWNIESFAANEVILYREFEGNCNEHYIAKDKDGLVVIYQLMDNGEEIEIEKTDISTDYLTQTDKINMQAGIKVYGKENLNQLIEDFE